MCVCVCVCDACIREKQLLHCSSRNRAIHGDTVVVQLFPRSEWITRSNALPSTPGVGGEEGGDHTPSEAMPTGMVVGILQRSSREYVASFAVSFQLSSAPTVYVQWSP